MLVGSRRGAAYSHNPAGSTGLARLMRVYRVHREQAMRALSVRPGLPVAGEPGRIRVRALMFAAQGAQAVNALPCPYL